VDGECDLAALPPTSANIQHDFTLAARDQLPDFTARRLLNEPRSIALPRITNLSIKPGSFTNLKILNRLKASIL
jgi:hypothetical protein